jgi:hypothetical protein
VLRRSLHLSRARHYARLAAAACAISALAGVADARAQVTGSFTNPLAPQLNTDPRKPPRFESTPPPRALAQAAQPGTFTLPPDGAGTTGYDSTNARKKRKPAAASRRKNGASNGASNDPMPLAQAPTTRSPYQTPIPPLGASALAAAPGTPPVELGPIRRPPRKKAGEVDDPYAPLGVRAGSFLLFPAIELSGGYSSNPTGTPGGDGAMLYTVAPELQLQSNWSSHELKADLRGSYTGYSPDTTPTLSRPNFNGKVDTRIDVTRTTRIDVNNSLLVSTDNPGSPNLQADIAKLPVYATFGTKAGIAHSFNRFELGDSGGVERTVYQDSELTDGTTASNADRQFNQYGGALRGSYELRPGVKPFVEVSLDQRKHDTEADLSGYRRNSRGTTVRVGSTFELTQQLTGETSFGYTKRDYEDERLENVTGFVGDASLVWSATALTTVKLTAQSSVGESTIPGVSGVLYRDVGVQVDHAFRRWLIGSAKLGFGTDDYVGIDRNDNRYSAGLGLTYKLDRLMHVTGEFRQDWFRSNVLGNDYSASTFLFGIRLQR